MIMICCASGLARLEDKQEGGQMNAEEGDNTPEPSDGRSMQSTKLEFDADLGTLYLISPLL